MAARTTVDSFGYTGSPQTWTVPAGVESATFELYGARGGLSGGGGARVTATLAVTPGATYDIRVGGQGGAPIGGWNGGGPGGSGSGAHGGGGGGASDLMANGTRLLVAAGGGGGTGSPRFLPGGASGAPGSPGVLYSASGGHAHGGAPGTQGGGGPGGSGLHCFDGSGGTAGEAGRAGLGGRGASQFSGDSPAGGGGGGYFGGGGGGGGGVFSCSGSGAGGGGGSSFIADSASEGSVHNGAGSGNGQVTVTYEKNAPPSATVSLDSPSPKTNDALTATATRSDPEGNPVSLRYVWKVNDTLRREVTKDAGTSADLSDSLDLSADGNGDRGDVITVEVTPSDGKLEGNTVRESATVADTPPECSKVSASPGELRASGRLEQVALSGATDPDAFPLSYSITGVTQDEPVSGGFRNDVYAPDAGGLSGNRVSLRGESNPRGNGRVYRIAYSVSQEGASSRCSGVAKVSVPVRRGVAAVDDGGQASWNSFTGALVP